MPFGPIDETSLLGPVDRIAGCLTTCAASGAPCPSSLTATPTDRTAMPATVAEALDRANI